MVSVPSALHSWRCARLVLILLPRRNEVVERPALLECEHICVDVVQAVVAHASSPRVPDDETVRVNERTVSVPLLMSGHSHDV